MLKKQLLIISTIMALSLSMLVGCNTKQETNGTTTKQRTTTKTPTTTHEHNYTEPIEAIGHNYEVVADSAINAACETDGKPLLVFVA